jgi:hypothetical protein
MPRAFLVYSWTGVRIAHSRRPRFASYCESRRVGRCLTDGTISSGRVRECNEVAGGAHRGDLCDGKVTSAENSGFAPP